MSAMHWTSRVNYMFGEIDRLTQNGNAEINESVASNYRHLLTVALSKLDPFDREDILKTLSEVVVRYQPHLR